MNFCKITLDIYENIYIIVNVSKSKTKAPPEALRKQAGSATVKEDGAIIVAPPLPKIKEELR